MGPPLAALQYEMLSREGVPPARAASGMTAASVLVFGTLLLFNVLALPLVVLGVAVPAKLLAAAGLRGAAARHRADRLFRVQRRPLPDRGTRRQWTINKLRRRSQPVHDLPTGLLAQRTAVAEAVGDNWWQALLLQPASGCSTTSLSSSLSPPSAPTLTPRWCSSPTRRRPFSGSSRSAPGGLGVVEAGLTGTLALIGVNGGDAVLATLAYGSSTWLYLPAGLVACSCTSARPLTANRVTARLPERG